MENAGLAPLTPDSPSNSVNTHTSWGFYDLGLPDPDRPLLENVTGHNNYSFRTKRILIFVGSICLTILVIALTMVMLLNYIEKQQRKPLFVTKFVTTTKSFTVTHKRQPSSTSITSFRITKMNLTAPSSSTISNKSKTTTTENCSITGWSPIGEILIKSRDISALVVDNDFNVYTVNLKLYALQKWSPGGEKPINLFETRFRTNAIFYHLLDRSLYFFYIIRDIPSIYKLVDDNSTPINVINTAGKGSGLNQFGEYCSELHVTSFGDIFVIDSNNWRVVKWTIGAASGILVAGGGGVGFGTNQLASPSGLVVDEINDVLYVVESGSRILKYTNGSLHGIVVFGGGPTEVLSNIMSQYVRPLSILVDKLGNILVGEPYKITKWTPDTKTRVIITEYNFEDITGNEKYISAPTIMKFDNLQNLYVYNNTREQVLKFSRNSASCTNNIH